MMPVLLPPRRRLSAHAPEPRDEAPRGGADAARPASRALNAASRAGTRYEELRLLIVDDDYLFADMLPRLLRKTIAKPALAVTSVRTVAEAAQRLAAEPFDVVLCDFDLREPQNGLDVLAHAARAPSPPFRILITGHSPREIPTPPEGVLDAFLDKPMTLREVVPLFTALLHERLGVEFEPHDLRR
ncbi:MAG: Response regulator receiver domain [Thermoplasmata archaeon]|jgi:CheY-like chemotaxis protein|nr:Response regulator receiver domain [Thermoplasmata archaeon]